MRRGTKVGRGLMALPWKAVSVTVRPRSVIGAKLRQDCQSAAIDLVFHQITADEC